MGGKIALIDSEHGSASLYADRFEFDSLELTEFQIENYTGALEAAAKAGYDIVIIDSTSHAWDALVERVDRIAKQKYGGNTWAAWSEGTPLQKKLIEAMLKYPGHIIVTCRSKTEYSVEKNDSGKTTIRKVGTAAVQRQGFEYEFTMSMSMDANHVGMVTKDRTSKFQDKFIEKPGQKFGKELIEWLNEGAEPPPKPIKEQFDETMLEIGNILKAADEYGTRIFSDDEFDYIRAKVKKDLGTLSEPQDKLAYVLNMLEEQKALLHKRLESSGNNAVATTTASQVSGPAAPAQTETLTVPVMYEEAETQTDEEQGQDDSFEDDLPWKKGEEPGKPGNGKNPAGSLREEFQKRVQDNAAAKETAMAAAGGELDIF